MTVQRMARQPLRLLSVVVAGVFFLMMMLLIIDAASAFTTSPTKKKARTGRGTTALWQADSTAAALDVEAAVTPTFSTEEEEEEQSAAALPELPVASIPPVTKLRTLRKWQSTLTRIGMISFIAAMCLALPLTLLPQRLLFHSGLITRNQKERWAVSTSQWCARWCLRLIPFCKINVKTCYNKNNPDTQPSVWVCNHTSMLDIFLVLAADLKLRGKFSKGKRPIKLIYWKQLEANPVTCLMFQQAGFIPVDMKPNAAGEDNEYDKSTFKQMLKLSKQAFNEGFDLGILPEGQLNPTPEKGTLPIFSGAFTLARMARRPIACMALHGIDDLWHPVKDMHCIGRSATIRAYPSKTFQTAAEFCTVFEQVVGHWGATGKDLPNWREYYSIDAAEPAAAAM